MGTLAPCPTHHIINCYICYYDLPKKPTGDKPRSEIEAQMKEWSERGWAVFVKWTCQSCKERCRTEDPNVFPAEFICPKCRYHSSPEEFGLAMMK